MVRVAASLLDSPAHISLGDPSGTLGLVASFGPQLAGGAEAAGAAAPADLSDISHVVVCGMGGSAAAGDAIAAAAAERGRVPVLVHRGPGVPAFVGGGSFVVASSYSGETAETVDALRAAHARGARGAAVTAGGTLAAEATRAGWPVVRIDGDARMPRFALGALCGAVAALLERMGLLVMEPRWRESVRDLLDARAAECHPAALANPAKDLARDLSGALPVVWGAGPAGSAAAGRWRNDLNENAKIFAIASALPEAAHNEVVGFASEGSAGRPDVPRALVCLLEEGTSEAVVREVAPGFRAVSGIPARGDGALGRFLDWSMLGGFVSIYLAILRGVDPAPIAAIERLRR